MTPVLDVGLQELLHLHEVLLELRLLPLHGVELAVKDALRVGEAPEVDRFWVAAGMNSSGIASAAGQR